MSKNKDKTQYGTFFTDKNRYFGIKKTFFLILFVAVLVAGIAGGLYKFFNKPKTTSVADSTIISEIPGWWLKQYFKSSTCENDACMQDADPDQDKLTNLQEYYYHTDPFNPHTAKDKLNDGELVAQGFDPSKPGKMTFEQSTADESLLGESLVYGDDIKKMVADENDISKVTLPLVQDDQLKLVYGETADIYNSYSQEMKLAFNRSFPQQDVGNITETIKSGSNSDLLDVKLRAESLAKELKLIPVPVRFLMFHKYNIASYQLLSEIILLPADAIGSSSDAWYDKAQEFFAVQQKLNFEIQALKQTGVSQ